MSSNALIAVLLEFVRQNQEIKFACVKMELNFLKMLFIWKQIKLGKALVKCCVIDHFILCSSNLE